MNSLMHRRRGDVRLETLQQTRQLPSYWRRQATRGGRSEDLLRTVGAFLIQAPDSMLAEFKRRLDHRCIHSPGLAAEWPISTLAWQVSGARQLGVALPKRSRGN